MNARMMVAGAGTLAVLAAVGVGAVSAQPRDAASPSKGKAANSERFDDAGFGTCWGECTFGGGPGFGRGAGRGWSRGGGRGMGGPGMRGREFGGPGMHGGGFGWGGPGLGGMAFGRGAGLLRGGERIAKALQLTDAQRSRLREIREDHHRSMIKARADMDLARMDLAALVRDEAPMSDVEHQVDAVARLQANQLKSMIATHREALDVLTAKQRDQMEKMRGTDPDGDDDDARPRRGSRR